MDIQKFSNLFWTNKLKNLDVRMYYNNKAQERRYNEKSSDFDPHYSVGYGESELTAREIDQLYNKFNYLHTLHGKKIVLGDYSFYGFSGTEKPDDFYKGMVKTSFSLIMEYHGYRCRVFYLEKYVNGAMSIHKGYGKSIKGSYEIMDLLLNFDGDLIDIDVKVDILGPKYANNKFVLNPNNYPSKKGAHSWSDKPIGEIDMDHFILMETDKGIYKPSSVIIFNIIGYQVENVEKICSTKLTDLSIHTVQFRNNSYFDISKYYDLEGIEIKASKTVFKSLPNLQKYCKNETIKTKIVEEDKADKLKIEKIIHDDTFTLSHHGKIILENVRSYEISNYFENRVLKDFELDMIAAGKKVFEAAPEMTKIFFISYGIYSHSELSGEKFVNYENYEGINNLKGITLPKRIVTLLGSSAIEPPMFEKEDKLFEFDRGAQYIGVEIDKNGVITMIQESGDQGI